MISFARQQQITASLPGAGDARLPGFLSSLLLRLLP